MWLIAVGSPWDLRALASLCVVRAVQDTPGIESFKIYSLLLQISSEISKEMKIDDMKWKDITVTD